MMKTLTTITASVSIALSAALAIPAMAQATAAKKSAQKIPKDIISGVLIRDDGAYQRCIALGIKSGSIYYKDSFRSVKTNKKRISDFSGIYLFDPPLFTEAKQLFKGRKYKEAIPKFEACQENYKKFRELENNVSDLSGFYILECYRKLHDYAAIEKKLELFITENLTSPSYATQLEVYKLWGAVNSKNWDRLSRMTAEWRERKVPVSIRAQIAFCEGLAHEGLGNQTQALNAYAMAMTADFTKSDSIVRQAALNSLRIFSEDAGVKTAIKNWKTEYEEPNKPGYIMLGEANAIARVYDKAGLGAGVELPAKYKKFQDYTSDAMLELLKEREEAANERTRAREEAENNAAKALGK